LSFQIGPEKRAEIIPDKRVLSVRLAVEEVTSVEVVVAQIIKTLAVEAVRSRTCGNIYDRA
jgi:hypothetical protein